MKPSILGQLFRAGLGGILAGSFLAPLAAEEMQVTKNLSYTSIPGVSENELSLDIYAPSEASPKNLRPVIVMIHGGAWAIGDKGNSNVGPAKAAYFTARGFVYISINYRLAPGSKYPANIQDVASALAWIDDKTKDYGGDRKNIFLMGHSAGAHLAALVAVDDRWLKEKQKSPAILRGIILLDCAAFDLTQKAIGSEGANPDMVEAAFGTNPVTWKDASPLQHAIPGKNFPPFLIFHADRRVSQMASEQFAAALRQSGGKATTFHAVGKNHRAINADIGQEGDPTTSRILEFLTTQPED